MTFDEWWEEFLIKWGRPKEKKQEALSRTFAETAWLAGHEEAIQRMIAQIEILGERIRAPVEL